MTHLAHSTVYVRWIKTKHHGIDSPSRLSEGDHLERWEELGKGLFPGREAWGRFQAGLPAPTAHVYL